MQQYLIELQNVTKSYRSETLLTTAVNEVNLTIEQGDFLSIMGPSGCGKSSLLNVIGLLDQIDAGKYLFKGEPTQHLNSSQLGALRKAHIGFVFQNFNLIDEMNVAQNIALPLHYHKIDRSETKRRVTEVMERLHIEHRAQHMPQQLSGGQQQRVAIARALVTQPELILADEPTGNLDSQNGQEVMSLLRSLNEAGTTIIMVTHSHDDASFGKRVVRMKDGQLEPTTSPIL